MRKVISIIMVLTLIMSISPTCFASECDEAKQVLFLSENGLLDAAGCSDDEVTYSIQSLHIRNSRSSEFCTLEFSLNVGQNTYEILASGELDDYELSSDRSVLHGCLRGNVEIEDVKYNVTVGLTTEGVSSGINAGVVLMPEGNTWSDDAIVFAIGDYTISSSVASVLQGNHPISFNSPSESEQTGTNTQDSGLGAVLRINASISDEIAQSIRVKVTPRDDVVSDYVDEHFSYTGSGVGASYCISTFEVGVRTTSSYFAFDGIYLDGLDLVDPNDYSNLIWAVIADVLSYYNVVLAGSLQSFLESMSADPVYNDFPDNCSIRLAGASLYDNIETIGLGCEFATRPNTSLTPGIGVATAYGNATYMVTQNIPLSGGVTYYLDANEVIHALPVQVGHD